MSSDHYYSFLAQLESHFSLLDVRGEPVQQLSVISTLPDLVDQEGYACFQKIVPKIQQTLLTSSTEFQVATARMMRVMIDRNQNVTILVPNALQGLENKDSAVIAAWLEALLLGIAAFPIKVVTNEIMPIALSKASTSSSTQNKVISCRLLGKICCHSNIESYMVKKEILPAVHSLCQDCNYEVRANICQQLPFIANGLGIDSVKPCLLSSIVELAQDDNVSVRAASAGIMTQMFPFLNPDTMKMTIAPMVIKLCESSLRSDDVTSIIIAREMGRFCYSLSSSLSQQDAIFLVTCYKNLAIQSQNLTRNEVNRGDPFQDVTRRQHCAFNLPAMTLFVLSVCPGSLDVLYSVFATLASDSCYLVRRIVASGVHEVGKCLGTQIKMIKDDIVKLLRDDSEDVLQCFIPHITATFVQLTKHNVLQVLQVDSVVIDIGRAVLTCEAMIARSHNWRLYTLFLRQLECLPAVFPSEFIHAQFLPIVFQKVLKGRAKPCRQQACRTLLKFLRYNNKPQQRTDIRNRVISELCHSKCCYSRIIFIRLCTELFELFSTEYFKEFFFNPLLAMTEDAVPNIRLCVVTLFPKLKTMLRLPNDHRLLIALESAVSRLNQSERDRDCRELLSAVIIQLQNIEVMTSKDKVNPEEQRLLDEEHKSAHWKTVPGGAKGPGPLQPLISAGIAPSEQRRSLSKLPSARAASLSRDALTIAAQGGKTVSLIGVSAAPRSSSVPPNAKDRPLSQQNISDMTILQQHFYTDAGIQLPFNALPVENLQIKNGFLGIRSCQHHRFGFHFDKISHSDPGIIIQKLNLIADKDTTAHSKLPTETRSIVPPKIRTGTVPKLCSKSAPRFPNRHSICANLQVKSNDLNNSTTAVKYPVCESKCTSVTRLKRRSLDISSRIPVCNADVKFPQCQKLTPTPADDVLQTEHYFNVSALNRKVCSSPTKGSVCDSIQMQLDSGDAESAPENSLQADAVIDVFALEVSDAKDQEMSEVRPQSSFIGCAQGQDLRVIGCTKLRLRKSTSTENKFVRNARNRFSLPAGSSLPIPIRKK